MAALQSTAWSPESGVTVSHWLGKAGSQVDHTRTELLTNTPTDARDELRKHSPSPLTTRSLLYPSPGMTHHRLGALSHRDLCLTDLEAEEVRSKVPAELVSSETCSLACSWSSCMSSHARGEEALTVCL